MNALQKQGLLAAAAILFAGFLSAADDGKVHRSSVPIFRKYVAGEMKTYIACTEKSVTYYDEVSDLYKAKDVKNADQVTRELWLERIDDFLDARFPHEIWVDSHTCISLSNDMSKFFNSFTKRKPLINKIQIKIKGVDSPKCLNAIVCATILEFCKRKDNRFDYYPGCDTKPMETIFSDDIGKTTSDTISLVAQAVLKKKGSRLILIGDICTRCASITSDSDLSGCCEGSLLDGVSVTDASDSIMSSPPPQSSVRHVSESDGSCESLELDENIVEISLDDKADDKARNRSGEVSLRNKK